jgi:hypothetical protein
VRRNRRRCGGPGARARQAGRGPPLLRDGERLFYKAFAWKGTPALGSEVGTATLTTRRGTDRAGDPVWRITARGSGSTMGYEMDARAVATLGENGAVRSYEEDIKGDRSVQRALMFEPAELQYLKTKHCHGCSDPAHCVEETRGGWFGMGGSTVSVHCTDRHCGNGAHRIWTVRHRPPADAAAADPLSALYRARNLDLRLGAPARTLRIAVGHAVFDVKVEVVRRAPCTVPAGTFDALQLSLDPAPAPGIPGSPRFAGLFGMSGKLDVWVDAARKIPLRISGTVPMGMDVNAVVVLAKIDAGKKAPAPKAAAPLAPTHPKALPPAALNRAAARRAR